MLGLGTRRASRRAGAGGGAPPPDLLPPVGSNIYLTFIVTADDVAPVLTLPTATKTGPSTFDWSVTTDEPFGILRMVVYPATTADPTAQQIAQGLDGAGQPSIGGVRSLTVGASGALAGSQGNIPNGVEVKVAFCQVDPGGNPSNVAVTAPFGAAPTLFAYTLVNEQGSATITAADMPELQVSINLGAWQTLTAAGLTLAYTAGKLKVSGLTGAETSVRFRFEDNGVEPYSAVDTVATADTTGTSIKSVYVRHATGPRPALGSVTANLLPGLPLVATKSGQPVVAL